MKYGDRRKEEDAIVWTALRNYDESFYNNKSEITTAVMLVYEKWLIFPAPKTSSALFRTTLTEPALLLSSFARIRASAECLRTLKTTPRIDELNVAVIVSNVTYISF